MVEVGFESIQSPGSSEGPKGSKGLGSPVSRKLPGRGADAGGRKGLAVWSWLPQCPTVHPTGMRRATARAVSGEWW